MPLIRRMPKRGFNNANFKTQYAVVNLTSLNQFEEGARVDEKLMKESGLANGGKDGVKILGQGDLKKKLTVCAHAFSASAKQKIEAAGGACEIIEQAKPVDKKA